MHVAFSFCLRDGHGTGSFAYERVRMCERRSERVVHDDNGHIWNVACCKRKGLLSFVFVEKDERWKQRT